VPPIIQFFASIECGFVRQFDSNHGGESSGAFSISAQRSNIFRCYQSVTDIRRGLWPTISSGAMARQIILLS
jgi:hypothetical protein